MPHAIDAPRGVAQFLPEGPRTLRVDSHIGRTVPRPAYCAWANAAR